MTLLNLLFVLFSGVTFNSNNNLNTSYTHEIKALKGDGIISLLRRYKLNQHQSNVLKFYELNNISSEKAYLHKGKKYKVPIKIYQYDGISIRTTIGNNDWDKAKRIKSYNEYLLEKGLRSTHYTKSKILWVPFHELNDIEKAQKISEEIVMNKERSDIIKYDLFGSNHREFVVKDTKLKNRVFYLISGHGGPDPGAMCSDCDKTLCEDEYAYDVTLRLAKNLMEHGAIVEIIIQDKNDGIRDGSYLKCDNDEKMPDGSSLHLNQIKRLNQRCAKVNHLYKKYSQQGVVDQSMVVIHVDSRSKSQRQDVFFNYFPKSNSSKKMAIDIMETFEAKYAEHQKGRNYKGYINARNLHVLRNTQPKGVFIELANIKNPHDHKRILLHENRQALANWIFQGITKRIKSDQIIASS